MTSPENNWAVVIPMANEENDFAAFVGMLSRVLDSLAGGTVYLVVDLASGDRTRKLCEKQAVADRRYRMVWAPNICSEIKNPLSPPFIIEHRPHAWSRRRAENVFPTLIYYTIRKVSGRIPPLHQNTFHEKNLACCHQHIATQLRPENIGGGSQAGCLGFLSRRGQQEPKGF